MDSVIASNEFILKPFNIDINITQIANIHYFEFVSNYTTIKDKHPFNELVYVDNGSIQIESENFCGTLCEKQLIIHKRNEIHSLICKKNIAPNVVIIGFESDCKELNIFSQIPHTLTNEQKTILTEIVKESHSVFLPPYDVPYLKDMKKRTYYPFGADQIIKLKLEILLIELIRSSKSTTIQNDISSANNNSNSNSNSNSNINAIYDYINDHYNEKITLDNLCFLFGTNKTTICKNFKNVYGETVINYINKHKIKQAKSLMRENTLSLTEISEKVGFSSVHYFSKVFKFYEHISPTAYMDSIKSKFKL